MLQRCSLCSIHHSVALNIRNPETERLAEALAKLTGESKTEAVTRALQDRLERVRRERGAHRLADEVDAIALRCASLPVRDPRPANDILGYDALGLPR
jgi:antitoxin VapB